VHIHVHTNYIHIRICSYQLHACIVDGVLTTFGCVEWESELCRGVMRARCYPFDIPKQRFHGMNPKVLYIHCTNMYIHVIYIYIHVHNMYIHGIYNVHVCMYCQLKRLVKEAAQKELLLRGAETRRRRKADWA
jgi:hypothetical protein